MGWIVPLAFLLTELVIYSIFKRWVRSVDKSLQKLMASVTSGNHISPDGNGIVAVLGYGEKRKGSLWVFMLFMTSFFFLLTLIAGLFIPAEPAKTYLERLGAIGFGLTICGLTPWLIPLYPYGDFRVITKKGIINRSPLTRAFYVRWDQIKSVRWISILSRFVLKTEKGRIVVPPIYVNVDKFAEFIMENLPKSRWTHAERMLSKALNGPFQPWGTRASY